jgi:oligopeptide/dipeptide ABC transporter ATP-binding protein
MIAIAICCKPQLLIADEPTTALDVTIQAQVLELLKDLQLKLRMSLILVTHDLGVVAKVCDRVAIMYAGKIVEDGDIYALYKDPKHPYTKGLLGATPTIQEPGKKLMTIKGTVPDLINPPSGCRFHPRCPYATKKCKVKEPPYMRVDGERRVACWLV